MVVALVAALMMPIVYDRFDMSVQNRRSLSVATALLFAFGTAAWSTAST